MIGGVADHRRLLLSDLVALYRSPDLHASPSRLRGWEARTGRGVAHAVFKDGRPSADNAPMRVLIAAISELRPEVGAMDCSSM